MLAMICHQKGQHNRTEISGCVRNGAFLLVHNELLHYRSILYFHCKIFCMAATCTLCLFWDGFETMVNESRQKKEMIWTPIRDVCEFGLFHDEPEYTPSYDAHTDSLWCKLAIHRTA